MNWSDGYGDSTDSVTGHLTSYYGDLTDGATGREIDELNDISEVNDDSSDGATGRWISIDGASVVSLSGDWLRRDGM